MIYHKPEQLTAAVETIRKTRRNPVETVTPENHNPQKNNFLNEALPAAVHQCHGFPESVNPTFVYDVDKLNKAANDIELINNAKKVIEDNLETRGKGDEIVRRIILRRIEDSMATARMAKGILDKQDEVTAMQALKMYGTLSEEDIRIAYDYAENHMADQLRAGTKNSVLDNDFIVDLEKHVHLNAHQLKDLFETGMILLGIKPWNVIVSSKCTAVDVRDFGESGKPTIWIPADRTPDGSEATKLVSHEIYCHQRGSYNCQRLLKAIFTGTPFSGSEDVFGKPCDEEYYEGPAKISDVLVKGEQAAPNPYAIIAIELAQKGMSFGDIAKVIFDFRLKALGERTNENIDKALKTAWATTYRVTRGSTDPWKNCGNYAFPKDSAYFLGYRETKALGVDSIYTDYASMLPDEIDGLLACYPELFENTSKAYTLEGYIKKMSMHVWATYHSYS